MKHNPTIKPPHKTKQVHARIDPEFWKELKKFNINKTQVIVNALWEALQKAKSRSK